ncbi:UNVERIFIED_CONTAM: hypothetical protein FKN15_049448 [Acipenser sinensis]
MTTRSEREKALKLNEQHQAILSKMLREEDNKYCADCEAKGQFASLRLASSDGKSEAKKAPLRTPKTPQGRFDVPKQAPKERDPLERFPDDINPVTKEKGGPRGPEPTRYGDWERKGRCIDF